MKFKFKNLKNKHLKVENASDYFGDNFVFKVWKEFDLEPGRCLDNALVLAKNLNVNGFDFEYVECLIKFNGYDGLPEDETYYKHHAISYWNGHYFDLTLEMVPVFNRHSIDTFLVMPDVEIIPIRRWKYKDILEWVKYSQSNKGYGPSFINKSIWVDDNGKLMQPTIAGIMCWKYVTLDGIPTLCIPAECFDNYIYKEENLKTPDEIIYVDK